jgi:hypothetical protein
MEEGGCPLLKTRSPRSWVSKTNRN